MHRSAVRCRWHLECRLPLRPTCPWRPLRSTGRQATRRVAPLRAKKQDTLTAVPVRDEDVFEGLTEILDTVKFSKSQNLVPVIVQAGT